MVVALVTIAALLIVVLLGAEAAGLEYLFGVVIPYLAVAIFAIGVIYRLVKWAMAPVPFRIVTTTGQQMSLPWIKSSRLESPKSTLGVIGRLALEILFFRSLFRNNRADLRNGPRLLYGSNKWLWAAGLAFHWSFLIVLLRHLRFFTEPVPFFVIWIQNLDGFFQIGLPVLFATDVTLLGAVSFLFIRRLISPKIRYISLTADYFPLLLILGIGITGVLMRYLVKTDVVAVKELAMRLATFQPMVPEGLGAMFFIHLFFASILVAYIPFSKLMHLGGVFLSPTRNLANNSRARRHVNPWDYPVKVHTYAEWEDDFRDKLKASGLPVDKEE